MYVNSLNAIRSLLKSSVPEVTTIYVDSVPANFVEPSFFVDHVSSSTQDLNFSYLQFDIQWQIVYFPPLKNSGIADKLNQYAMADTLAVAFAEKSYIKSPDGTVFHILSYDGGPKDDELYVSVKLQAHYKRDKPIYDLMQNMHLNEEV